MPDLDRTQLESLFYDNSGIELFRAYKEYIKSIIVKEQQTHKDIKITPFYEWRKLKQCQKISESL